MPVTAAIVATHVEHDLTTDAIERLIEDAERDVELRAGSNAARTEQHILPAKRRRIFLKVKAASLISVQEGEEIDELTALVEDTDHKLVDDGWVVERLGADFQSRVEIRYAPEQDTARRDRVIIDLVRLAVQYSGLAASRDGDHSETQRDYQMEREHVLRALDANARMLA